MSALPKTPTEVPAHAAPELTAESLPARLEDPETQRQIELASSEGQSLAAVGSRIWLKEAGLLSLLKDAPSARPVLKLTDLPALMGEFTIRCLEKAPRDTTQ